MAYKAGAALGLHGRHGAATTNTFYNDVAGARAMHTAAVAPNDGFSPEVILSSTREPSLARLGHLICLAHASPTASLTMLQWRDAVDVSDI